MPAEFPRTRRAFMRIQLFPWFASTYAVRASSVLGAHSVQCSVSRRRFETRGNRQRLGFVWDGNPGAYSNALISEITLSNTTGLHFNLPCVETHEIVDMRTITLGAPPQEVHTLSALAS